MFILQYSRLKYICSTKHYTLQFPRFGRIPPQCFPQADGSTTLERAGRWMGVSYSVGSDGRGRITGSGDLGIPTPEHSCTVHWNQDHYGPVSSVGAVSRFKDGQAVVVRQRDAYSSLGGGTDGGGGGYWRDSDGDIINRWADTAANTILGTEPNSPLASA